ncbi:ninjurin-B-like [Eupeodes corollae]|uniref:ninjurin-B-like n=1 Tax=Eupeodes corollae TaxID=290404 RepID=UPI002490E47C|nr:ninjurin-B-like [Eupeodes corollae]
MDEKDTENKQTDKLSIEEKIDIVDIEEISHGNQNDKFNLNMKTTGTAEGMINLTLLTANGNQLRSLVTYDTNKTALYYISFSLIILSLILQVCIGITIILKKTTPKRYLPKRTNQFYLICVFIITFINVLIFIFTLIKK